MKTKKIIISSLVMFTLAALFLNGCKKEDDNTNNSTNTNNTNTDASIQTQKASDDSNVEGNSNSAFDDANTAIDNYSEMSGKKEGAIALVCGADYDTTEIANKILYLNFDGTTPCVNATVKRSGQIKLQLPINVEWKDEGAVLTVTFNNYKVTRISDSKSLTFNGVATVKNTSGGSLINALFGDTLTHQVRINDMELTFDDGTKRNWSGAWKRAVSASASTGSYVITVIAEGDTTLNGVAHTEMWGTTRAGDPFTTTLTPPITFNTVCWNKAISGMKTITVTNAGIGVFVLNITVGVDQNGNVVTNGCPYGIKLNWTNLQNQPQQVVIAYQ